MGISVSAKCKLSRLLELDKSGRYFILSGRKLVKEHNEDITENASTRTIRDGAIHSIIPRLQIPSESNSSSDTEGAEIVSEEKVDVQTKTEAFEQKEPDIFEWRPQILNPEQASLSWSCDVFSKESDQAALGWASHIHSESVNGFGNGEPKETKHTNYSPLVENDMQEPVSSHGRESELELIIEHVPPKPKDRKNFIRQNVKEVKAKRTPKSGSYSQLMTARLQSSVGCPSNIENVSFGNLVVNANDQSTSPTVKLERLLQGRRINLIHVVDDFLRENSQEITMRSVSPEEIETEPPPQPKIQRHTVKLVNFKNLDMYVKKGVKCDQLKDFDDGLHVPRRYEFSSVRHEATSLQLRKSPEISIPFQVMTPRVQENPKSFPNFKKFEIVKSQDISQKAKSKREIMMEYSKSVSAANLVCNKKSVPRIQTRPQLKLTGTLDEELAKILQAHEEETRRIASLFLS